MQFSTQFLILDLNPVFLRDDLCLCCIWYCDMVFYTAINLELKGNMNSYMIKLYILYIASFILAYICHITLISYNFRKYIEFF